MRLTFSPWSLAFGILFAGGATVACAGTAHDDGTRPWGGTRQELSNGAALVVNPSAGIWQERDHWRLEADLRIGTDESVGPTNLGRISALGIDRHGGIHIFDASDGEVRSFMADGRFRSAFGRKGRGPGEFHQATGIAFAPDGELWVLDPANARYTIVQQDSVRTVPRVTAMWRPPWVGGFSKDGHFYDVAVLGGRPGESFLKLDATGKVLDTLDIPSVALDVPRKGRIEFPIPFGPKVLRAFDPRGYVWLAPNNEYRLTQLSLAGDTILVVTRPRKPTPLSSAQSDSIQRYLTELEALMGVKRGASEVPKVAPLFEDLIVDDRGYLWVALAGEEQPRFDVFDPEGLYLGQVFCPCRLAPDVRPVILGSLFYAVIEDSLGVQSVMRAKVLGRS